MAGMFPSSKIDRARISKLPRTQRTQRTLKIPRTKKKKFKTQFLVGNVTINPVFILFLDMEADVAKGPIRTSHFQSN